MITDFTTTLTQLRAAKAGDSVALNELLARYEPRVRTAVAVRLGRVPSAVADLDDTVQEVMLAAFRSLKGFEGRSEGAFLNWLTSIAVNEVREAHRHAARHKRGGDAPRRSLSSTTFPDLDLPATQTSPTQAARVHEIEEARFRALLRLPPHHRDIIVDHAILGLTHEEIAQGIGDDATAARARALYNRAVRKLRTLLQAFDATDTAAE